MLLCPICGKEPKTEVELKNNDHRTISCCSLLAYEFAKSEKRLIGIWNDKVVEYRKMVALERLADKSFVTYQTNPYTVTVEQPELPEEPFKYVPYPPYPYTYPSYPHPYYPTNCISSSDGNNEKVLS